MYRFKINGGVFEPFSQHWMNEAFKQQDFKGACAAISTQWAVCKLIKYQNRSFDKTKSLFGFYEMEQKDVPYPFINISNDRACVLGYEESNFGKAPNNFTHFDIYKSLPQDCESVKIQPLIEFLGKQKNTIILLSFHFAIYNEFSGVLWPLCQTISVGFAGTSNHYMISDKKQAEVFKPKKGLHTGHAVGFAHFGGDGVLFFDPNYGEAGFSTFEMFSKWLAQEVEKGRLGYMHLAKESPSKRMGFFSTSNKDGKVSTPSQAEEQKLRTYDFDMRVYGLN